MCGRYSFGRTDRLDWISFGVAPIPDLVPNWNISPGTNVLAVRQRTTGREAKMLRWGLVPHWAQDPSIGHRLVNARAESAHEKPAFRDGFAVRRCLLPADGFYEWQVVQGQKKKQPWRVERQDGRLCALGAIWERWRLPSGESLETCVILTVPANRELAPIHDRMPVIVTPEAYGEWLSPATSLDRVRTLSSPAPDSLLEVSPESSL